MGGLKNDLQKRKKWSRLGYQVKFGLILKKMIVIEYFLLGRKYYPNIKNPK
jgi:hypothetical protein